MKNLSLILFVIGVGFVSCKNEADPEADKSFFTKFYDNASFNIAYIPLDAAQTSDGGYLVLAVKRVIDSVGVHPGHIYIMKTDEFGAVESDTDVPEGLGLPAPQLVNVAGKFYFFCMQMSDFAIQLIEVGENGTIAQQLNVDGSYPLAAGTDGTSLLLLSYDQGTRTSIMSVVATDGHPDPAKSKAFTIGAAGGTYAPENSIFDHVLRTGPQLPFFVGKIPNGPYYFNGMYDYTLSTVFTDLGSGSPSSVVQGNREDGGISALYPLNGGKFAVARFNYGDNYLLPAATLTTSGLPSSAASLGGNWFPELLPNAPVKIINTTINANERIIYATNTRSKQIVLLGYNPTDGSLIGSKYIGFSNSFELASIKPTVDDGLLVLGTTYIAGRFPRICLFKLSAEALGKSFQ